MALSERPDLILMDISLARLFDGWEATRRIKANAATRAIPVHWRDRARDGRRPREGDRGGLRGLRHEANRIVASARQASGGLARAKGGLTYAEMFMHADSCSTAEEAVFAKR